MNALTTTSFRAFLNSYRQLKLCLNSKGMIIMDDGWIRLKLLLQTFDKWTYCLMEWLAAILHTKLTRNDFSSKDMSYFYLWRVLNDIHPSIDPGHWFGRYLYYTYVVDWINVSPKILLRMTKKWNCIVSFHKIFGETLIQSTT